MATDPDPAIPTRLPEAPRWRGPGAVVAAAYLLVAAAAGWYLLTQLAVVLRPLLVAVFLAYVLLPYHSRLRKRVGSPVSIGLLAGATAGGLALLALAVYAGVTGLNEEVPLLKGRAKVLVADADRLASHYAPWLSSAAERGRGLDERLAERVARAVPPMINGAADALLEAGVVGLYLLFLLLEAARFPARVRGAYPPRRADEILHLAGQINSSVVSYLKAKVKASLVLAAPAGLVLVAFGVHFAPLWAILTFLCNFVPYVGSVIAYSLPVGFAFLQYGFVWEPVTVAVLLLATHVISATMVEPTILGRAVGLSPLVILAALAFWGLLWSLPGMVLAVPLTCVAVIVMGQFEATRPLARMMSGE